MNHYPPLTPSALFVDVDQAYMGNSMCDGCWAMPNMGLNLQHFFAFEYRHTRNALSTPISLECQQKKPRSTAQDNRLRGKFQALLIVPVNCCGTLSGKIFKTTLFGHEIGASIFLSLAKRQQKHFLFRVHLIQRLCLN